MHLCTLLRILLFIWHSLVHIGYLNTIPIPETHLNSIIWNDPSHSYLEQCPVFHTKPEFSKPSKSPIPVKISAPSSTGTWIPWTFSCPTDPLISRYSRKGPYAQSATTFYLRGSLQLSLVLFQNWNEHVRSDQKCSHCTACLLKLGDICLQWISMCQNTPPSRLDLQPQSQLSLRPLPR